MLKFLIRRLITGLLTAFLIVTIAFFALRLVPGDPSEIWLGEYWTPELGAIYTKQWGLDKPIYAQYAVFLSKVFHGDLGNSLRNGVSVMGLIGRAYPYTLRLMVGSVLIGVVFGTILGTFAARRQNTVMDIFTMIGSFLFISSPSFLLAYTLMYFFAIRLDVFPIISAETPGQYLTYLPALFLPWLCVGLRFMGMVARMTRSGMIEVLSADYIRTARSKGLHERVVLYKHALRNTFTAGMSLIGVEMIILLGGVVIPETIFTRPGLGRLYFSAVSARDYPMVQGCILVIAAGVVCVNLVVDLLYGVVDPRVRYE
jgi:ABC-type dipeptide/oligopeptide/nickel transport system permease component